MSNMVVRTNMLALNSHRNLGNVSNSQQRASARLSSGFRINSAADDAAGLGISENMRAQIRGLDQASRNAQDAISLVQTAEGGLNTIGDMVIRIRELTVQAANDTNTREDAVANMNVPVGSSNRAAIQREVNQLIQEIGRTAETLEFNTQNLLQGDANGGTNFTFQIGANSGQTISVTMPSIVGDVADALASLLFTAGAVASTLDVNITTLQTNGANAGTFFIAGGTADSISNLLSGIDAIAAEVVQARGELGALENRLEFTIQNLDVSSENLSAANSRIRDADMAREMMSLTQANVLQQAAISMLAQGNQAPQNVLQLLR